MFRKERRRARRYGRDEFRELLEYYKEEESPLSNSLITN